MRRKAIIMLVLFSTLGFPLMAGSNTASVFVPANTRGNRIVVDLAISKTGGDQLQLTWSGIAGATGYKIYHCETPDTIGAPGWTELTTLPSGTTSYPISPVVHGFYYATYFYTEFMLPLMVFVQGGTFSPWTNYNVTLSNFNIGMYELTQLEYTSIMNASPFEYPGAGQPAENVSWFDAIEYCNRLSIHEALTPCYSYSTYGTNPDSWPTGWNQTNSNHLNVNCNWSVNGYRLPTEMEWMYTAKGGGASQGFLFSGSDDPYLVAWFAYNNYPYGPKPVGTLEPNELGTYDQSGNVYEWVWDMFSSAYPTGTVSNPTGPTYSLSRVLRGGNWNLEASLCTVRSRESDRPVNHDYGITGFRVCRKN